MLRSLSEFKFYQTFRIPVNPGDGVRFLVERENELGKDVYVEDARIVDISISGLGLKSREKMKLGDSLTISLQYRKIHLDLEGEVVRILCQGAEEEEALYGVELEDEPRMGAFLEQFVSGLPGDRLRGSMLNSVLRPPYANSDDGLEMFSLLLAVFNDITFFGDKEDFAENMLEEVVRVMNAQRASIFLINPESSELEAVAALGVDKKELRFDYRMGIAGSVFTTGAP